MNYIEILYLMYSSKMTSICDYKWLKPSRCDQVDTMWYHAASQIPRDVHYPTPGSNMIWAWKVNITYSACFNIYQNSSHWIVTKFWQHPIQEKMLPHCIPLPHSQDSWKTPEYTGPILQCQRWEASGLARHCGRDKPLKFHPKKKTFGFQNQCF